MFPDRLPVWELGEGSHVPRETLRTFLSELPAFGEHCLPCYTMSMTLNSRHFSAPRAGPFFPRSLFYSPLDISHLRHVPHATHLFTASRSTAADSPVSTIAGEPLRFVLQSVGQLQAPGSNSRQK